MNHLFDFGISQEDALTESRALELKGGDRLLCIASAGEVPLNILARNDIHITAVDISASQIYLSRLKLLAARYFAPIEAAEFLGYFPAEPWRRLMYFQFIFAHMEEDEKLFWREHLDAIRQGPIRVARFEQYISKFSRIAQSILGKKKLLKLFDLTTTDEQREYFDRYLSNFLLRGLFKVVFHPKIYKKRGISTTGLQHMGQVNLADFFYGRFRNFCTATPARKNYFLQYTLYNQVLFPEALPEFLQKEGIDNIKKKYTQVIFKHISYSDSLEQNACNTFNKFQLSNISDWMDHQSFAALMQMIHEKSTTGGKLVLRYIHNPPQLLQNDSEKFIPETSLGDELIKCDRYPFYNIIPVNIVPQ